MTKRASAFKFQLSILALLISWLAASQNLLINGDFENGGSGTGFNINGSGYNLITQPFAGTTSAGDYAFVTDPQPMNTAFFISGGDHTSGTGKMMAIDGNTTGGPQRFWRAGSSGGGVCSLTVGATYLFKYWIKSIATSVTDNATSADIGIQFNNASTITLVSGSALAALPASGWQEVVYSFVPTNACVNIELWNNNTSAVGNDFAVDDFSLVMDRPLSLTAALTNPTCANATDGSIIAFGSYGTAPYAGYVLSGTAAQSNSTGVFTGLPAGTYSVSITDANGTAVNQSGITLLSPALGLVTSADVSICPTQSTTLSANAANATYVWSASPPDPTISDPASPTPTVTPASTTVYTVTATTTNTVDILYNGSFSLGNTGFTSDYTFMSPNNPSSIQNAYGITASPSAWHTFLTNCGDHTTGSGPMMVTDASTVPNVVFWEQSIAVVPGQDYTFSYWTQSLHNVSPAVLRTLINGVVMGDETVSATTCDWIQYSYTWNSGSATLAKIQLVDLVTSANGNDFAIDDLKFETEIVCSVSKATTITVAGQTIPVMSCGANTINSVSFSWPTVTGATGYSVSHSVNGGGMIADGTISPTTFTISSLNPGDSVTLSVLPTGPGCYASGTQTCVSANGCQTPVASVTVQPACMIPTGTIVITAPIGTGVEYSVDGINYQSGTTFTGLTPGPRNVTVKNPITGCISPPLALNVVSPAQPDISASATNNGDCSFALSASSTTPGNVIVWNGPGLTADSPNPAIATQSGTFAATVTDPVTSCQNTKNVVVVFDVLPVISIHDPLAVCEPSTVNITMPDITAGSMGSGTLSYWNDAAQTSPLSDPSAIAMSGTYYIQMTNTDGCSDIKPVNVIINDISLVAADWTVDGAFNNDAQITITPTIAGNYAYQLDWGISQPENIFESVTPGRHEITVYDLNGCSAPLAFEILVIGYPHYFTPNADNFHDFWNVIGLDNTATVFIFDRYGKLLKQISPESPGWDGTYNGAEMPSSDYWFTANYNFQGHDEVFRAHFSLKR